MLKSFRGVAFGGSPESVLNSMSLPSVPLTLCLFSNCSKCLSAGLHYLSDKLSDKPAIGTCGQTLAVQSVINLPVFKNVCEVRSGKPALVFLNNH